MVCIRLPSVAVPLATIAAERGATLGDVGLPDLIALYKAHGAVLLRGFAPDINAFVALARRLCPTAVMNESPGRVSLDPAGILQSVNLGGDAFPLHPELSREPWKPDAALFACMQPPAQGGETTVCDGVALARALPEAVRLGLEARRLVHSMPTWPELLEFWLGTSQPDDAALANPPPFCPYSFRRVSDDRIAREFSRPALHRPMFADGPAFGNFLLFARFYNGRGDFPLLDDYSPVPEEWLQAIQAEAERQSYPLAWQAGDVLVLDNTRFMHGRRPIADPAERHIVTYFGYLSFAEPDPEEPRPALWRQRDFAPPPSASTPR